ncbi:uncharacterized protein [Lolium perenne]|uniref:uncharacterized protein n=1 Tax=Lolium perenne TaxID=4522 RepID=UPI003A993FB6
MVVAEAPAWLLEEINKWMRAFFWAGKDEVQGGQCLVAWKTICKPKKFGGLGVKDLRRTDRARPWQGLPGLKDPEAEEVFQSLAHFKVGDGLSTYFWKDRWISGFTAAELAPEVVARVPTRRKNERLVGEALPEDGWIDDMSREMTEELWRECLILWEAVETVMRDAVSPDHISWKGVESGRCGAESYTVRAYSLRTQDPQATYRDGGRRPASNDT